MVATETKFIPLPIEPLLLGAKQLATVLNISPGHLHALDNTGKLPSPRRLNKSVRWSVAEIREWIAAGCPDRITWNQIKNEKS